MSRAVVIAALVVLVAAVGCGGGGSEPELEAEPVAADAGEPDAAIVFTDRDPPALYETAGSGSVPPAGGAPSAGSGGAAAGAVAEAGAGGSAGAPAAGAAGGGAGMGAAGAPSAGSAGSAGASGAAGGTPPAPVRFCRISGGRFDGHTIGCDAYSDSAYRGFYFTWQVSGSITTGCADPRPCAAGNRCRLHHPDTGEDAIGVCLQ
jgi:hypothetical protein